MFYRKPSIEFDRLDTHVLEIYFSDLKTQCCNSRQIISFLVGALKILLPINIDKFSTTSESLYAIASLSLKYNLTSYDASYLELAIRMNSMIATLDKNLILACNLANVKVY